MPSASAATTYTVTTNADSGAGSLRQAITDANANAGTDTINFNLPSAQLTITLLSDLPHITDPVIIDGTTQPVYAGTPRVELNGNSSNRQNSGAGLYITAGSSTVRGLIINRFGRGPDIGMVTNGGNVVENCYIGVDRTGTLRRPNGLGIITSTPQNRIGGPSVAQRNLISGNDGEGIAISGSGNVIPGNYIGTNAAGTSALPNIAGISASAGVLVGGTAPGAGNLISGNLLSGIEGGGIIQGNLIGTDASGARAVPNDHHGISVTLDDGQIGGTEPGARNVISGNRQAGIWLGENATGNVVEGNYIGVAADGTTPLANSPYSLVSRPGGIYVGNAQDNRVGGTAAGAGNVIAFNGAGGVVFAPASADAARPGISVRGNSVFSNDGPGIDLHADGVTPNDANDADTGANNRQNFPPLNFLLFRRLDHRRRRLRSSSSVRARPSPPSPSPSSPTRSTRMTRPSPSTSPSRRT